MKWLAGITVLCLVGGAVLRFAGQQERACFWNLLRFEHYLNCPGVVASYEDRGAVLNGVWVDKQALLNKCFAEALRCPVTGKDCVLTFTVGEHPYCPVHGRLIEKYGFRVHTDPLRAPGYPFARRVASGLLFMLGILLAVTTGIVALARLLAYGRKRRLAKWRWMGKVRIISRTTSLVLLFSTVAFLAGSSFVRQRSRGLTFHGWPRPFHAYLDASHGFVLWDNVPYSLGIHTLLGLGVTSIYLLAFGGAELIARSCRRPRENPGKAGVSGLLGT